MDKVKADAQEKGDLGLVAEASRSTQRTMFTPAKLTVSSVFSKLREIAHMAGNSVSNNSLKVLTLSHVSVKISIKSEMNIENSCQKLLDGELKNSK